MIENYAEKIKHESNGFIRHNGIRIVSVDEERSVLEAEITDNSRNLLPFDVIGASVIAMFIGMLINGYRKPGKTTAPGVKFTAKKILKFAIILLGASLNVTTILNVGRMSLTVMLFTLLTCFGGGYFIGRALGLDWKLSNLISAGTGICGGSAIAAEKLAQRLGLEILGGLEENE